MGDVSINSGFCWESNTGIYYDILGRVCGRLAAGWGLLQRHKLHACPAGGYFSVKKSNQKSLGEVPEAPTRRYTPLRKRCAFPERD